MVKFNILKDKIIYSLLICEIVAGNPINKKNPIIRIVYITGFCTYNKFNFRISCISLEFVAITPISKKSNDLNKACVIKWNKKSQL